MVISMECLLDIIEDFMAQEAEEATTLQIQTVQI